MTFFSELKRRNVFRMGIAYLAAVWVLIEVADTLVSIINAPVWIPQVLVFSAALGFPLALILAWFYEWTPDGIQAASELEVSQPVRFTGRKIDFAIIGLLVLAVGFLAVDDLVLPERDRSLAVLPFTNLSAAGEDAEFFSIGMHDALLNQLAKIGDLKVISRTSVLEYADSRPNMRQIGDELDVATILEGNVLRAGDELRVVVQLIDAETDEHLWSEDYNRELTAENIFAVQNEMATAIANALEVTLSPQQVAELSAVPTESTRAWDFYVSGNDYMSRADERMFAPLAVTQYEGAVMEDHEFAQAWAALSQAHMAVYFFGVDRTDLRRDQARAAVERAVELAPDLPETHLALGRYQAQGFQNYEEALREYAIAEAGMPGSAGISSSRALLLRRMGRLDESIDGLDRVLELDPRNTDLLLSQAESYAFKNDYAQAERLLDRVLEISPDERRAYAWKMQIPLWRDGDVTLVKAAADDRPIELGFRRRLLGWIAALYEGDYEAAVEHLDRWDIDAYVWEAEYIPKSLFYGTTYRLAEQPELAKPYFEAAHDELRSRLEANPDDERVLVSLGEALGGLGQEQEAVDMGHRALELMPWSRDSHVHAHLQPTVILRVFMMAGAYEEALQELDNFLLAPDFWSIEGLLPDPRLDFIRDDPRFQELVEKYRRP